MMDQACFKCLIYNNSLILKMALCERYSSHRCFTNEQTEAQGDMFPPSGWQNQWGPGWHVSPDSLAFLYPSSILHTTASSLTGLFVVVVPITSPPKTHYLHSEHTWSTMFKAFASKKNHSFLHCLFIEHQWCARHYFHSRYTAENER